MGGSTSVIEPSRDLHNGHRWFLQFDIIEGQAYPDGLPRLELFAVREDGQSIQLTDDASLATWYNSSVAWSPGDESVSWSALRWEGGVPVEAGIYGADVVYDAAGDVVGLAQERYLLLEGDVLSFGDPGQIHYVADIYGHDWSPDGSEFVFHDAEAEALFIADLLTQQTMLLLSDHGWDPRWSPAGNKIIYNAGKTIRTINIDGTGLTTVAETKKRFTYLRAPHWSPTGSHIVYMFRNGGSSGPAAPKGWVDVYRATADGGKDKNLTTDTDAWVSPVGWR
jgi:hypothetical protein